MQKPSTTSPRQLRQARREEMRATSQELSDSESGAELLAPPRRASTSAVIRRPLPLTAALPPLPPPVSVTPATVPPASFTAAMYTMPPAFPAPTSGLTPAAYQPTSSYMTPIMEQGMAGLPAMVNIGHIPETVRTAIRSGSYVDMGKLLPKPSKQEGPGSGQTLKLVDGKIQAMEDTQVVGSFFQWVGAWAHFMTIRGQAYPHELIPMIAYQDTIRSLASQGKDAIGYDIQFRAKRADFPQLSWGSFMPQMVADKKSAAGTGTSSVSKSRQPEHQSRRPYSGSPSGVCRNFNSPQGSSCSSRDCRYRHVCSMCQGKHQVKDCKKEN